MMMTITNGSNVTTMHALDASVTKKRTLGGVGGRRRMRKKTLGGVSCGRLTSTRPQHQLFTPLR